MGVAMGRHVDYLVVGAGATALAFVDAVFHESDATFAIVDRCDAPGGHWNYAYRYVSLHQPASCYGVASRALGTGRLDETGYNRGLESLASGIDVASHFHGFMRDTLAPSGRVDYHPMTSYEGDGDFVSLLSGQRQHVEAKVVVDATLLETRIPLTHSRSFTVGDEVTCVAPNDLPRLAPSFEHYTVLGAGKTGLDAALWLLSHDVAPERITWVIPRDPWMINRAAFQPGLDAFRRSAGLLAAVQAEAAAQAETLDDLCDRLEAGGAWLRLDPNVWPTMQHCASVTVNELEHVRRIDHVVRLGRVTSIEPERLVLEHGERTMTARTLFIDCTASALEKAVGASVPVFGPAHIALQMIRLCQPTFSAALIGHIEVAVTDDADKQALTAAVPMPDTVASWASAMSTSTTNERAWLRHSAVRPWLATCRLNPAAAWSQIPADDTHARTLLDRVGEHTKSAIENLQRLATNQPGRPPISIAYSRQTIGLTRFTPRLASGRPPHADATVRTATKHPSNRHVAPWPVCAIDQAGGHSPSGWPISHSWPKGSMMRQRRQPCSSCTADASTAPASTADATRTSGASMTRSVRPVVPPMACGLKRFMAGSARATQNAASPTASWTTMSSPSPT
jgi:hypothetical protein